MYTKHCTFNQKIALEKNKDYAYDDYGEGRGMHASQRECEIKTCFWTKELETFNVKIFKNLENTSLTLLCNILKSEIREKKYDWDADDNGGMHNAVCKMNSRNYYAAQPIIFWSWTFPDLVKVRQAINTRV